MRLISWLSNDFPLYNRSGLTGGLLSPATHPRSLPHPGSTKMYKDLHSLYVTRRSMFLSAYLVSPSTRRWIESATHSAVEVGTYNHGLCFRFADYIKGPFNSSSATFLLISSLHEKRGKAPESRIRDSIGLSTHRTRSSSAASLQAEFTELEASSLFFFGALQSRWLCPLWYVGYED